MCFLYRFVLKLAIFRLRTNILISTGKIKTEMELKKCVFSLSFYVKTCNFSSSDKKIDFDGKNEGYLEVGRRVEEGPAVVKTVRVIL